MAYQNRTNSDRRYQDRRGQYANYPNYTGPERRKGGDRRLKERRTSY